MTDLEQVNVLVKFAMPQVLNQMTDLAGAVHTGASANAATMQIKSFTDTEVVKVGTQFWIAGQMTTYTVNTQLTLANQATTGSTLAFFPGLEAATTAGDVITFIGSTLQPVHEDLLERMVCLRAVQSDSIKYTRSGAALLKNYLTWINNGPLTSPVLLNQELVALANPGVAKSLPRGTVST